jgi:hypothetical protein
MPKRNRVIQGRLLVAIRNNNTIIAVTQRVNTNGASIGHMEGTLVSSLTVHPVEELKGEKQKYSKHSVSHF